jgi:hypothetical protein
MLAKRRKVLYVKILEEKKKQSAGLFIALIKKTFAFS